jgi:hypothetical protein
LLQFSSTLALLNQQTFGYSSDSVFYLSVTATSVSLAVLANFWRNFHFKIFRNNLSKLNSIQTGLVLSLICLAALNLVSLLRIGARIEEFFVLGYAGLLLTLNFSIGLVRWSPRRAAFDSDLHRLAIVLIGTLLPTLPLLMMSPSFAPAGRAIGLWGNPNWLGWVSILTLIIILIQPHASSKLFSRTSIRKIILMTVPLISLMLSGSRGAMVTGLILVSTYLVTSGRRLQTASEFFLSMLTAGLVVWIVVITKAVNIYNLTTRQGAIDNEHCCNTALGFEKEVSNSLLVAVNNLMSGRLLIWSEWLDQISSSTVLDSLIGIGRPTDFSDFSAHNLFIEVFVRLGFMGLLLLCISWVSLIVIARRVGGLVVFLTWALLLHSLFESSLVGIFSPVFPIFLTVLGFLLAISIKKPADELRVKGP